MPELAQDGVAIDACWTRIGTLGDGSCPRLETCLRCLNCPVFEQAAARMLDRPVQGVGHPGAGTSADAEAAGASAWSGPSALRGADAAPPGAPARRAGSLVFRVGAEWLALPVDALQHVDEARPIHSLPHRRSAAVLGVVNVRGVLTLAASLAELLHVEPARADAAARAGVARLLVAAWRGESTAFPVDEVEGVAYFGPDDLLPAPATLAHAAARHVRGVIVRRGRPVGVLDVDALFEALARNLR